MRHQYGGRRGADRCDDTPGKVKLTHGLNQQRAVAEALSALNAAGKNDDIEVAIGDFHQWRIGQQLDAARADNRQIAIAGDAGGCDLYAAANE